jgi:outer membrane protein TolC
VKRLGLALVGLVTACVHSAPRIDGVASTPSSPSTVWQPSSSVTEAARRDTVKTVSLPTPVTTQSNAAARQYSLGEVVDIALKNSPATRLSYTQARAAADVYGSSEGRFFPTVTAGLTANRSLQIAAPGRPAGERNQYGPSLSLSYTVLDFGGRSGSVDVARQTAIAADLTHNATVQNTILQVESAAFYYLSTRSQRDAQK